MSVSVFLSGAIEYCGDYAHQWREIATPMLEGSGYKVFNPLDVKVTETCKPHEIVDKNLFLQKRSDILLVEYMIPNRCYIGTDFEMTYAKLHGQPIIVFCDNENKDRIYLKYLATKVASSLEEAVEYIRSNYPTN